MNEYMIKIPKGFDAVVLILRVTPELIVFSRNLHYGRGVYVKIEPGEKFDKFLQYCKLHNEKAYDFDSEQQCGVSDNDFWNILDSLLTISGGITFASAEYGIIGIDDCHRGFKFSECSTYEETVPAYSEWRYKYDGTDYLIKEGISIAYQLNEILKTLI